MFDSKDVSEDSLVVIGNGFDLAHGLKTSYSDFRIWLLSHGHEDFVVHMEDVFYGLCEYEDEKKLWADFESSLGTVDIDTIHSLYQEEHKGKDVVDDVIEPTVLSIRKNFTNWIKHVNIQHSNSIFSLPSNAYYLSFNYTDTLESIYEIPKEQICYIHGCQSNDDKLIYGCLREPIHKSVLDREEKDILQYPVRYKATELLNGFLKKNTIAQIEKKQLFFKKLDSVKNVFVIGHSLAEVDWPYFLEIRKHVPKETIWRITYHKIEDKIKLQSQRLLTDWNNILFKQL